VPDVDILQSALQQASALPALVGVIVGAVLTQLWTSRRSKREAKEKRLVDALVDLAKANGDVARLLDTSAAPQPWITLAFVTRVEVARGMAQACKLWGLDKLLLSACDHVLAVLRDDEPSAAELGTATGAVNVICRDHFADHRRFKSLKSGSVHPRIVDGLRALNKQRAAGDDAGVT